MACPRRAPGGRRLEGEPGLLLTAQRLHDQGFTSPTPCSPTSSTERGLRGDRAAATASTTAAREPTSVAAGWFLTLHDPSHRTEELRVKRAPGSPLLLFYSNPRSAARRAWAEAGLRHTVRMSRSVMLPLLALALLAAACGSKDVLQRTLRRSSGCEDGRRRQLADRLRACGQRPRARRRPARARVRSITTTRAAGSGSTPPRSPPVRVEVRAVDSTLYVRLPAGLVSAAVPQAVGGGAQRRVAGRVRARGAAAGSGPAVGRPPRVQHAGRGQARRRSAASRRRGTPRSWS